MLRALVTTLLLSASLVCRGAIAIQLWNNSSTSLIRSSTGIATPTPIQAGMTHGCTKFYKVKERDSCQEIAKDNGIPIDDFLSWNPAVGKDCMTLKYDFYVCVGKLKSTTRPTSSRPATPTPTQTGMTDKCTEFHMVKEGETCEQIANDSSISRADFFAWNPAVGEDCMALRYGFYVCVGKSLTAYPSPSSSMLPTPTSTTSSVSTTINTDGATPTPTQTGMVPGCTKFHKVKKGEYCEKIADDYSISLDDLIKLNPDVGKECRNLKYDFYLCVR